MTFTSTVLGKPEDLPRLTIFVFFGGLPTYNEQLSTIEIVTLILRKIERYNFQKSSKMKKVLLMQ